MQNNKPTVLELFLARVYNETRCDFGDYNREAIGSTIHLTSSGGKTLATSIQLKGDFIHFVVFDPQIIQPSCWDVNASEDRRNYRANFIDAFFNPLPAERRQIIFSGECLKGKIVLKYNPKFEHKVRQLAQKFGATIDGKINVHWMCWESFGMGWADPREL